MIRIKLHSKMGNQMFQYAFGLYASKKLKTSFVLNFSCGENRFQLLYFTLKFPHSLITINRYTRYLYKVLFFNNQNEILAEEKWDALWHSDISLPLMKNGSYKGYFQNADLCADIKNDLLKQFRIKKRYGEAFKKTFAEYLTNDYAVVHFRFGDYKDQKLKKDGEEVSWMLPDEWYLKCRKMAGIDAMKLLVISDDMKLARQIDFCHKQVIYPEGDAIMHFQLLMQARVSIISNSTYAWWGAFLNSRADKIVYAPKYFLGYNLGISYPGGIMTNEFIWVD